jgi:hypothetical protein
MNSIRVFQYHCSQQKECYFRGTKIAAFAVSSEMPSIQLSAVSGFLAVRLEISGGGNELKKASTQLAQDTVKAFAQLDQDAVKAFTQLDQDAVKAFTQSDQDAVKAFTQLAQDTV